MAGVLSRSYHGSVVGGESAGGGTRAVAVVLFTDLVGSTELRARLGEDAAEELRRRHDTLVAAAIEANRGRVVKHLGDGMMATFAGASDAVGAAASIQQAVDRHLGPLVEVRVGISAGDVTLEQADCFGTPVIEAARLCAAAAGGQAIASDIVRLLAGSGGGHAFTPLGPLSLKGLPDPVSAWEVAWQPLPVPSHPLPALLTDMGRIFVGRDGEFERLERLWKEAAAGARRVALVSGEPGIGKTRLAAELAARAHEEGALVLAGRCDEDLGVPYQPFVEALRHFVDHTPVHQSREQLGRYGGELVRLVPELAEQVGGLPPPLTSDPETERYRLFDAVAAWLSATAAAQPLLLILDDLQWAAKPTLLLLRHVVRSPDGNEVLVLGTYRDTEVGRDLAEILADLHRQDGVERISLSGLDSSGVAAFMAQAAGQAMGEEDLPLGRAIHEETEGNPFFVRELLRHLIETGAIVRRDGRWGSNLPVEELGIPDSVREVVGRRLSRLSEEANQVLRIAAVVGSEFELPVVHVASGLDEDPLLAALDEGTSARLIVASAERYRFAHALVRDALYGQLSAPRRAAVHRRVADAIEAVHRSNLDEYLPALAHHCARSADIPRAVDYAKRAGDRALAQLAHDEAVVYYRQALGGTTDEQQRLDLLVGLGEALHGAGDAAYRTTLLDAAGLAKQLGDPDALATAALANTRTAYWSISGSVDHERVAALESALEAVGDGHYRARLLAALAAELVYTGDRDRCERYSDEALQLAREDTDPETLARVLLTRHFAIWGPEGREQRDDELLELVGVADRLGDPVVRCWAYHLRGRMGIERADRAAADTFLDRAHVLTTDVRKSILRWFDAMYGTGFQVAVAPGEEAERLCHQLLELGLSAAQPEATSAFAVNLTLLRLGAGDPGDAEESLHRAQVDLPGLQNAPAVLALLYCATGQNEAARELLSGAEKADFARPPQNHLWLGATLTWAAVADHLGDVPRVAALHGLLCDWPEQISTTGGAVLGSVSHYVGLLARTLGRFDEAEERFATALAMHDRLGAPRLSTWTRVEWARMLLGRGMPGDEGRARELVEQALVTAREFGLTNYEQQATELLA